MKLFFDLYSEEIGVKIIYIMDVVGFFIVCLEVEGEWIFVDMLIIVDVGNFW